MMKKEKHVLPVVVFLTLLCGAFVAGRRSAGPVVPVRTIDTVVVRDTVRDTVPTPRRVYLTRVDTVVMRLPGDTVEVPVLVPVERKVYATDDYRAVVSGFRPSLDSMEVYRRTEVIARTVAEKTRSRTRAAFGIGVGVSYDPLRNRFAPAIQVGIYVPIGGFGRR